MLLLILIWACFAIAIFLTLEDSLPLAHIIEDSGRYGLHSPASFLQSRCSWFLHVSYHRFLRLSFNLWLKIRKNRRICVCIFSCEFSGTKRLRSKTVRHFSTFRHLRWAENVCVFKRMCEKVKSLQRQHQKNVESSRCKNSQDHRLSRWLAQAL